jgi:ABC-type transporter Mla subunit MlaD
MTNPSVRAEVEKIRDDMEHLIEVLAVWWCDHPDEYTSDDVDEVVGSHVDNQREAVERLGKFIRALVAEGPDPETITRLQQLVSDASHSAAVFRAMAKAPKLTAAQTASTAADTFDAFAQRLLRQLTPASERSDSQ